MKKSKNNYRINFCNFRKEIIRNPKISRCARLLYADLITYAGVNNQCFPSQKTLAEDLGYTSPRQINTLLKELKEKTGLNWMRGGIGKSNFYRFSEQIYSINNMINNSQINGSAVRIPKRNLLRTKVDIIKDSHINSSSHHKQQLLNLLKIGKIELPSIEINKILNLPHSFDDVLDSIVVSSRRGKKFNAGYLSKILEDWKINGKPDISSISIKKIPKTYPRPVFKNCDKCKEGYGFNDKKKTYYKCECRKIYEDNVKIWDRKAK